VKVKYPTVIAVALVVAAAAARGQEEEGGEGGEVVGYLPPSVYPTFTLYGGGTWGPSYDAAADISARAARAGLPGRVGDIGTMPAFGFAFDYFFLARVSAGIKIMHSFGARRAAAFSYNYADFPKMPPPIPQQLNVEESLSYQFQNVDYKATLTYVAFPTWTVTPYAGVGFGGNSTMLLLRDQVSPLAFQKRDNGLLLANGWFQRFSFDWAVFGGARLNLGANFYLTAEYYFDRPFHDHYVAGYRYHTPTEGAFAGAGWRFL